MVLYVAAAAFAPAAAPFDKTRAEKIAALLPEHPSGLGEPITNRVVWEKLAATPGAILTTAESMAEKPTPALPDDLYLDYSRTGNRDHCQKVMFERRDRLTTMTLAECLEGKGRFIPRINEEIRALCAERTWVYPAHDGKLDNFNGRVNVPDLRATAVAWELATVVRLLGNRLPADTRQLITDNVRRRVLNPFRDMVEGRQTPAFWLTATHNWNAVCLAGVAGAALGLEEAREDRAFFVAATQHYIQYSLAGFGRDGYCSEGIGYWNYGFGHFAMISETIRQATHGGIDLFALPAARQPARFGARDEIINGIFPTIADVHPGTKPSPELLRYVNLRFGTAPQTASAGPTLVKLDTLQASLLYTFLPKTIPVLPDSSGAKDSALRTWFDDGGVLICRTAPGGSNAFGVVLKGGHNAENHNHNDVGSFSVVSGRTMLICDPGAEVYTARTFGARRYESKVLNSFGHAVPRLAGQLQKTGADARAVVLATNFTDAADTLALNIASAYAVRELKKLERTFVFQRSPQPALTVTDEVSFSEPKSFETALVTWSDWKMVSENEMLIATDDDAVRVRIDTGGQPFEINSERLDEDVHTPRKPVRLGIALKSPLTQAVVKLTITTAASTASSR